jgi:hypothetical protein
VFKITERETCTYDGFLQLGAVAYTNTLVVQEGAASASSGKKIIAVGVINYSLGQDALLLQSDGHGVLRKAMKKIGRAVQRIDDPYIFRVDIRLAAFFAQKAMVRICVLQRFDDGAFSRMIDFTDKIVECLAAHLESANI